jgi:hypothetical protein
MKKIALLSLFSSGIAILASHQVLAQQDRIGLIFEGFGLNLVQIKNINYVGDCPGFERQGIKTYFTHAAVPGEADLRIKLVNNTDGVNPQKPPTKEIGYKKSNLSSSFTTRSGTRSDFGLLNGSNTIEYQIFDRKTKEITEQGSFPVEAKISSIERPRWADWQTEQLICLNGISTSSCDPERLALKSQLTCPDGRILQSRTRPYKK